MNRPGISLIVVAALVSACADGTLPPRSAGDPANPKAVETPVEVDAAPPAASVSGAPTGGDVPPKAHEHHHPTTPPNSGGSR